MPARKKEEAPAMEQNVDQDIPIEEQDGPFHKPVDLGEARIFLKPEVGPLVIYGLWSPSLQLWWPPQAASGATIFHTPYQAVAEAQLRNILSNRNGGYRRDWMIQPLGETPAKE